MYMHQTYSPISQLPNLVMDHVISPEAFTIHWKNILKRYDTITDSKGFEDPMIRTLLENLVKSIADLRAVKSKASQLRAQKLTAYI